MVLILLKNSLTQYFICNQILEALHHKSFFLITVCFVKIIYWVAPKFLRSYFAQLQICGFSYYDFADFFSQFSFLFSNLMLLKKSFFSIKFYRRYEQLKLVYFFFTQTLYLKHQFTFISWKKESFVRNFPSFLQASGF